jgi:hypothetical protein
VVVAGPPGGTVGRDLLAVEGGGAVEDDAGGRAGELAVAVGVAAGTDVDVETEVDAGADAEIEVDPGPVVALVAADGAGAGSGEVLVSAVDAVPGTVVELVDEVARRSQPASEPARQTTRQTGITGDRIPWSMRGGARIRASPPAPVPAVPGRSNP